MLHVFSVSHCLSRVPGQSQSRVAGWEDPIRLLFVMAMNENDSEFVIPLPARDPCGCKKTLFTQAAEEYTQIWIIKINMQIDKDDAVD